MFVWLIAARLPTSRLTSTTAISSGCHIGLRSPKGPRKTRRSSAKDAALDPTDRYAVTVVGAPSYASGAHIWKGAADTLKSKPTEVVTRARKVSGSEALRCPRAPAMARRFVDPESPYSRENPNARKPLENAPSNRYFKAASFDRRS